MRYSIPVYRLRMVKECTMRYAAPRADCPENAAIIARERIGNADTEHMIAILLDGQNVPLAVHTIAVGGMHGVCLKARDVFKAAIVHNAAAIILAHNHPSGNSTPSHEDRVFTSKIHDAADIIGIPIVDHIVVARGTDRFESIGRTP